MASCSPEATRERDGGPGADPLNKRVVRVAEPMPQAADTTLWPGRAPTPNERLARGDMHPPAGTVGSGPATPPGASQSAAGTTPATRSEQGTFDKTTSGDSRRPPHP